MIDIVVAEAGTLLLAHDRGDCGRIDAIELRPDGLVRVLSSTDGVKDLKRLTPRMLGLAKACNDAKVVEMDGFEISDSYPCRLVLPSLAH